MHQDSIASSIFEWMKNMPSDTVYIATDFLDFGEYNAVRQALLRLEKSEKIKKVMRGVYYLPRYSELIGEYEAPSPTNVAGAIARKFNWTISPCGDVALNELGLSTQVPAKWTFISDGPYHQFQVGNLDIEFKHRNNREISDMSPMTALVIQALKALGKENIDDTQISVLKRRCTQEDKTRILKEAQHSTMWIYDVIKRICS